VSDATLRALERAAASGSVGDRAAYLRARLRAGEECTCLCRWAPEGSGRVLDACRHCLDDPGSCHSCAGLSLRSRVEMGAYCGDEGARLALSCVDPHPCGCWRPTGTAPPCKHSELGPWARALSRWGQAVHVRAAVAAARVALPAWRSYHDPGTHRPRLAIEAAEAWLADPCEERLRAWQQAMTHRTPLWTPFPVHDDERHGLAHDYPDCVQMSARLAGEAPVREAIQSALIGWALA